MRPSIPQPPRRPSRPDRAPSLVSERRRTPAGYRRSPEDRPSSQRPLPGAPDPASRRALTIACRERRRRRTHSRLLHGTTFVVALALIVVGLWVWGLHPDSALPLGSSTRQLPTPAKATVQSSARVSTTRTASLSASVTPSVSPTPSASVLPPPQLNSKGFMHSGTVGNGSWTITPAVPVPRPAAATVYRYVLWIEGGMHIDVVTAAPIVERILNDERGWPTAQNTSFQPVADPASTDFTFNIATPPSIDTLCSPLDTGDMWGYRNGNNVVINSDRWNWGAVTYPDVGSYRTYVTNHGVGHLLDRERELCAGVGLKAPLMAQQSHDLAGGCMYNTWFTQDNQPGRGARRRR